MWHVLLLYLFCIVKTWWTWINIRHLGRFRKVTDNSSLYSFRILVLPFHQCSVNTNFRRFRIRCWVNPRNKMYIKLQYLFTYWIDRTIFGEITSLSLKLPFSFTSRQSCSRILLKLSYLKSLTYCFILI